jgi:anti-sigma factor RsiW
MNDESDIDDLLSRGLDAELNRAEMRRLYHALATDSKAQREAAALVALEERMATLAEATASVTPRSNAATVARLAMQERQGEAGPSRSLPGQLWAWLRSPHGIRLQPLSFASGVALAAVLALVLMPAVAPKLAPEAPRLDVQDVQFETAHARVDWTYRFIVPPGGAAQVVLDSDEERPMQLRLETTAPSSVTVRHHAPNGLVGGRDFSRTLVVDGIGFASLRRPRAGDVVTISNSGDVPVLVYAYTSGYGGSWVLPAKGGNA